MHTEKGDAITSLPWISILLGTFAFDEQKFLKTLSCWDTKEFFHTEEKNTWKLNSK